MRPILIDGPLKGKSVEVNSLVPLCAMEDYVFSDTWWTDGEMEMATAPNFRQVTYTFARYVIFDHVIVIGACRQNLMTSNPSPDVCNELFDTVVSERGKEAEQN